MNKTQLQFGYRKPSANRGSLTRRLSALAMSLLLVCSLPLAAFAEEYDLAQGSITVTANGDGQYVTQENGVQNYKETSETVIKQAGSETSSTANTITINADAGATANVTLKDVNIDVNGYGEEGGSFPGDAAIQTTGDGDVAIELDGSNAVQSGWPHAGVEKNNSGNLTITDETGTSGSLRATGGELGAGIGGSACRDGSDITITGNTEVTAKGGRNAAGIGGGADGDGSNITIEGNAGVKAQGGFMASGIGGGQSGSGSDITITGNAEVTAKGGSVGSGIGGGFMGTGSDIIISGDAQVKAQGGERSKDSISSFGAGAAIGNGGNKGNSSSDDIDGEETTPNTDALTTNGKIEYYAPGEDMSTAAPYKTVHGTVEVPKPTQSAAEEVRTAPLYRVVGKDGKGVSCETERKDGVLTITVDADSASLTGYLWGIQALQAQGVDTIVFVTNGATSTFALADLMSTMTPGDSYTLTHDGSTTTFTLATGTDISSILK